MLETTASHGKYRGLALLLAILALALDQYSKWLILTILSGHNGPAIEATPFFNIVLVRNSGISFGMFAGERQPLLLTAVSVAVVITLLIWLMKNSSKLVAMALGSVIGGAIGNMIDRVRFGAVTDFLDFHLGVYHWPAFNIADSCIFIGVVLLCMGSMFTPNQTQGSMT